MGKRRKTPESNPEPPSQPFHGGLQGLAKLKLELAEGPSPAAEDDAVAAEPSGAETHWLKRKLVVAHQRKGRGGKTATRLSGLGLEPLALDDLARELAKSLGCRARCDGDVLELSGDLRQRLAAWLRERGAKRVVVSNAG